MFAKERLYLTADNERLVPEGDPAAATLYAIPGDEIPASAAAKFALIDGGVGEAILRAAALGGIVIEIAGMRIGSELVLIGDDQIDEAQLLAILEQPSLVVEVQTVGDDWIGFPGREEVVAELRLRVAADIEHGRAHRRVTRRPADDVPVTDHMTPIPPAVEPAPAAPIVATDTVAAPVADVVGADAVASAIEGNAPLPTPTPIAPDAPIAGDAAPVLSDDAAAAAIRGDAPLSDAVAPAATTGAPAGEPLKEAAPAETKEVGPGDNKERRPRETKARPRAQAE